MYTRLKQILLLGGIYLGLVNISSFTPLEPFLDLFFLTAWVIMLLIVLMRQGKWLSSFISNYPSFSLFLFCIGWLPYINTPIVFLKVYLKEYYQDKPWFDSWEAFLTAAETLTWIVFIISVAAGLILSVRNYRNSRKKFDKI